MRPFCVTLGLAVLTMSTVVHAQAQTTESEPNNMMHVANLVALGDTMMGHIDNISDHDVFKLHVDSGVALRVQVIPGSNAPLVPHLELWDSRGYPLRTTWSPGRYGLDRNIWFLVTRSGDYFVRLSDDNRESATGGSYVLLFLDEDAPPVGNGDPAKLIATRVRGGMVAGSDGDFYVASFRDVVRVPKSGGPSTFASLAPNTMTGAIAIDAGGNFLVAGDSTSGAGGGVVWRISPSGARSVVYHSRQNSYAHIAMAVAPNGDLWVSQYGSFVRIDTHGSIKDTIAAFSASVGNPCSRITFMAFSPAGELHYTAEPCAGVFKLSGNTTPKRVFDAPMVGALAFDRDGYLYILNGMDGGRVMILDPQYRVKEDVWASRLGHNAGRSGFNGLAFARDRASGNTLPRLFLAYDGPAGDGQGGWVIEFNKDGVRAPGWPVGFQAGHEAQMSVTGRALRSGTKGKSYADTLKAKDAPGSVTWSITSGTLPAGVAFEGSKGTLSGTPTDTGSFAFDATASSGSQNATGHFTIRISTEPQMQIDIDAIATALLGGAALAADQVAYLDQHGNHNGVLDVGDLRAYLRALGTLAGGRAP